MSKHYPGPYQSNYNGYYYDIRPINDRSGKPGFFTGIATVQAGAEHQYEYALTPEEAKATARLMAASPTMLKWLKWLRDSIGPECYPGDITFDGYEVSEYGLNELIRDIKGGD